MPLIPVIDTFCFNGERIVPFRLAYLKDVVDAFVIVEAWETHSGERKSELFRDRYASWFEGFTDKIHWVIVERFPPMPASWPEAMTAAGHTWMGTNHSAWFREGFQRDAAWDVARDLFPEAGGDCLLHVSDADEIVRREILAPDVRTRWVTLETPAYLQQTFFYYNTRWVKPYPWMRAYLISRHRLTAEPTQSLTYWRVGHPPHYWVLRGGFHFSYFMTPEDLQRKLQSFAHRECHRPEWSSLTHIQACFQTGRDLFDRGNDERLEPYVPEHNPDFPQEFLGVDAWIRGEGAGWKCLNI